MKINKEMEEKLEMLHDWSDGVYKHIDKEVLIDKLEKGGFVEINRLYDKGYRKITQNSAVIPKEISCYKNIQEGITTFRLDENNVDFTDEQIMALTQIILFKEKQENEIRKETANKIFQKGKEFCFISSDKSFNLSRFLDWIIFEFELAKANYDGTIIFDKKYFKE